MQLPRNIANSIDQIARTAMGKDWNLYASLLERWTEIVGPDYAQETTPVKISFPHGKKTDEKWAGGQRAGGTLTIRLPQGLSLAFTHHAEQVRSRINTFFGYEAIERITLKPFYPTHGKPLAPPQRTLSSQEIATLKEGTKDIENNELRDILEQLGTSVLANQKRV
ncbi:MAG: DciA family protein [Alphaproteobacteria bacterium]|nr:DciA family protein [Alphaproteobacteria bacterium]